MDNVREKLVELLESINAYAEENLGFDKASGGELIDFRGAEYIADHLIANGVTAQEWIPVTERLPEKGGLYITFGCTAVPVRWLHNFDKDIGKFGSWWNYEPDGKEHPRYRFIEAGNISHWAPLPTPPEGE